MSATHGLALANFWGRPRGPAGPQPTAADSSTRRSPPRLVTDTIVPRHRSSMCRGARTGEDRSGVVPSEQGRGQVEDVAVDQSGSRGRRGPPGPALHQDLEHPPRPELVEHPVQVTVDLEGGGGRRPRRAACRGPPGAAGSRARGSTGRREAAARSGRVVGPHRARPDQHGVGPGPQAVGVQPGRLAGDPPAGPVGGGDAPVERGGQLEDHPRPTGACGASRRRPAVRRPLGADAHLDLDARRLAGRRCPVPSTSGSGS